MVHMRRQGSDLHMQKLLFLSHASLVFSWKDQVWSLFCTVSTHDYFYDDISMNRLPFDMAYFRRTKILRRYSGRNHWIYLLCHHRQEIGRAVL